MITRKIAMTAGAAAAAALVATGVTYASAPEVPSAAAATPTVNQAAPTGGDSGQAKGNGATAGNGAGGAVAGNGGDSGRGGDNGGGGGRGGDNGGGGGRGGDNGGGGGRGGDDGGGRGGDDDGGRGGDDDGGGRDGGGRGGRGYEGRIDFNERSYSAQSWGCITVVSGLGSRSFNVRNDSHRTVEVFRGATCDNGSPVATVGPWSTTNGVVSHFVHGGVKVRDGVVGSFRVVRDRHGW
ncbi:MULTISPECIES: hypothetical protein [unclassified Streptomyces]|uniref:hypothetical protein n=1 Tax=unclassified Streptomyces TaxID=2593676 RepID=UPI002E34DB0E|nr:hypothetical protein [Streptomyces sp. NBC_01455]